MDIKSLAVRQPFAGLIAFGYKTMEIRTRNTAIRGDVAIYASVAPPASDMLSIAVRDIVAAQARDPSISPHPVSFPTRKIVAIAEIVGVVPIRTLEEFRALYEKHYAPEEYFVPGRTYGWCLGNVRRIVPIHYMRKKGSITWANVDIEPEYIH